MLECPSCGATHADGPEEPWRCPCGAPLELATTPEWPATPPADPDRDRGLWAFEPILPVERRVTLGEGWTPVVDAPGWEATFKLEYVFPTGSFKDRGATATLSRAAAVGADRVLEDSSGNAGAAIATYAARAGIDAGIYVPAGAKPGKVAAIEATGADVVRIEGDRGTVTRACLDAVETGEGWYASHAWNPAFLAGTSTFALELCAQRGWRAPDAVVCPVGHGTLFLGAYRGFRRLHAAGWTDRVPRLLAAQAEGYAPFVDGTDGRNVLADGIRIRDPARGEEIREAIEATDGAAIAIGEAATRDAHERLRGAGFGVEPTCAVAPAALERYRERGTLDPDADVVVPLTGRGSRG